MEEDPEKLLEEGGEILDQKKREEKDKEKALEREKREEKERKEANIELKSQRQLLDDWNIEIGIYFPRRFLLKWKGSKIGEEIFAVGQPLSRSLSAERMADVLEFFENWEEEKEEGKRGGEEGKWTPPPPNPYFLRPYGFWRNENKLVFVSEWFSFLLFFFFRISLFFLFFPFLLSSLLS